VSNPPSGSGAEEVLHRAHGGGDGRGDRMSVDGCDHAGAVVAKDVADHLGVDP
jgi:hypothetical protein